LKVLEETAMHTSPTPPSPEEPSPVEEADGGNILYAEDLTKTSDLLYFNGLGGFTPDGREYVVILQNDQHTPLPWSNVVANPRFGFIATESGGGYTWFENSRENKLSPWSNDPVSDIQGEILYLGDEAKDNEFHIRGAVRNIATEPLEQLDAAVRLYAHDGTILQTTIVRMNKETIAPDEVAQFELVYPNYKNDFMKYSVEFKLRDGALIPYKDMRTTR
jgi:hypothetical protein